MKVIGKAFGIILLIVMLVSNIISSSFAASTPEPVNSINSLYSIQSGDKHIIALTTNMDIKAWGKNTYGQLGNGSVSDSSEPVIVNDLFSVTGIAAGKNHNLAIKSNGDVYAWGDNSSGQLGDGTKNSHNTPVLVNNLSQIYSSQVGNKVIAAGNNHSLALRVDGTVWAWGDNTYGQLGDGTNISKSEPVEVPGLHSIIGIAAGENHSMALQADGTVWVWGDNKYGQLGNGTTKSSNRPIDINIYKNTAIASGGNHCLALQANGDVYAWGKNTDGQLGDGTMTQRNIPTKVKELEPVIKIAAGSNHSLAITDEFDAYTWGRNAEGQLGDGTTKNKLYPTIIAEISYITEIFAGGNRTFAVKGNTYFYVWGEGIASSQVKNQISKVQNTSSQVAFVNVEIDGKDIEFTTKPRLINNKTVVPVRDILQGMGATVTWDGENNIITGIKGQKKVSIKIGSDSIISNEGSIKMDVPTTIIDERAFAQVRTIAESLGESVIWDGTK
ncbi:MAG: stalk domain-containing protein, partial [bacterium]|nr:stalk domain-containing protein [bacterium]